MTIEHNVNFDKSGESEYVADDTSLVSDSGDEAIPSNHNRTKGFKKIAAILALGGTAGACTGSGEVPEKPNNRNNGNIHRNQIVQQIDEVFGLDSSEAFLETGVAVGDVDSYYERSVQEIAEDQAKREKRFLNVTTLAELRAKVAGNPEKAMQFEEALKALLYELDNKETIGRLDHKERRKIDKRFGGYKLIIGS